MSFGIKKVDFGKSITWWFWKLTCFSSW